MNQDILQIDLPPNYIDAIFSFEFLEHVSDLDAYYQKAFCWLKRGEAHMAGVVPMVLTLLKGDSSLKSIHGVTMNIMLLNVGILSNIC